MVSLVRQVQSGFVVTTVAAGGLRGESHGLACSSSSTGPSGCSQGDLVDW